MDEKKNNSSFKEGEKKAEVSKLSGVSVEAKSMAKIGPRKSSSKIAGARGPIPGPLFTAKKSILYPFVKTSPLPIGKIVPKSPLFSSTKFTSPSPAIRPFSSKTPTSPLFKPIVSPTKSSPIIKPFAPKPPAFPPIRPTPSKSPLISERFPSKPTLFPPTKSLPAKVSGFKPPEITSKRFSSKPRIFSPTRSPSSSKPTFPTSGPLQNIKPSGSKSPVFSPVRSSSKPNQKLEAKSLTTASPKKSSPPLGSSKFKPPLFPPTQSNNLIFNRTQVKPFLLNVRKAVPQRQKSRPISPTAISSTKLSPIIRTSESKFPIKPASQKKDATSQLFKGSKNSTSPIERRRSWPSIVKKKSDRPPSPKERLLSLKMIKASNSEFTTSSRKSNTRPLPETKRISTGTQKSMDSGMPEVKTATAASPTPTTRPENKLGTSSPEMMATSKDIAKKSLPSLVQKKSDEVEKSCAPAMKSAGSGLKSSQTSEFPPSESMPSSDVKQGVAQERELQSLPMDSSPVKVEEFKASSATVDQSSSKLLPKLSDIESPSSTKTLSVAKSGPKSLSDFLRRLNPWSKPQPLQMIDEAKSDLPVITHSASELKSREDTKIAEENISKPKRQPRRGLIITHCPMHKVKLEEVWKDYTN